jgi:cell division protein FtsL
MRRASVAQGVSSGARGARVKRDIKDSSFMYTALIVAVIVVLAAFFYLWCRNTYVNFAYEISSFNETRGAANEQNKRLRLELERLKSPERIERIATAQGLIYPTGGRIVYIPSQSSYSE